MKKQFYELIFVGFSFFKNKEEIFSADIIAFKKYPFNFQDSEIYNF